MGAVFSPLRLPESIEAGSGRPYLRLNCIEDAAMPSEKTEAEIIEFPNPGKQLSSTEKIWGKAVYSHGYAGIPSILIQGQRRLGLNPMQMNICIQLLDYWFEPTRKPSLQKRSWLSASDAPRKLFKTTSGSLRTPGWCSACCARPQQATGTATSTT